MEVNPSSAYDGGLGSGQGKTGLNNNFKLVKQYEAANRASLKNLAPHADTVREFGGTYDMGSEIGMIKVNTADSARLNIVEMGGKGGLVDEVF